MIKAYVKSSIRVLLIVLLSVLIHANYSFAAVDILFDFEPEDFSINPFYGIQNVYIKSGSFRVSTTGPYVVRIDVKPSLGWTSKVLMNTGNSLVNNMYDYEAAFDISLTDASGIWQDFSNRYIWIVNQPPTGVDTSGNPIYRQHDFCVALVLVDQRDADSIHKDTSGVFFGEESIRRFNELPSGTYSAEIIITVEENVIT